MFIGNINIILLLVATLVGMAVGFVWYSPLLFGNLWLKSKGWTEEMVKAKTSKAQMWRQFPLMTLSTLVMAFILSVFFNSLVVVGLWGILYLALAVWIAFIVPVKLGDYLFGGDTFTFFLISIGHYLVTITLMSFILGLFS